MHRITIHETTYAAIVARRLPGGEFRFSSRRVPGEPGRVTIEVGDDVLAHVTQDPTLTPAAFVRRALGLPPLGA